jgi:3-methyl-2-oxobutanoate hydroxymethyltransferase
VSKYSARQGAVTMTQILAAKGEGRRLSVVTCYDAAFARLVDQTAIDMVLVGDSLGNVMLGFEGTIPVTVDMMAHHTAAVARVLTKPFLIADMPFMSYQVSAEDALRNAGRLVQQSGAQAVKLEGGRSVVPQVKACVAAGIPVMGHLGLTPQSVHAMGGYKVQGRGEAAGQALLDDALALQEAGCFSVVLEMVPSALAERVTKALRIPTIGIGAGPRCDGQVLVLHDLLGFDEGFNPKFLKKFADLGKAVREAVSAYDGEVKAGVYPGEQHGFKD